jgi:hypothetical protein
MKESPFGFQYDWGDLEPVRALFITVLIAQVIAAAVGLWLAVYPSWFDNVWAGATLATFPAFLLGLPIQHFWRPGALSEHRVLVGRMGLVALVLSLAVFVMPLGTQ